MVPAVIAGLSIGIVIGLVNDISYPMQYSFYITVALLAAMDSLLGAVRSNLEGKYNTIIFLTGFLGNALLAALLAYLGDKLGVPLYYAAIFVFGGRLFQNLAVIRRILLDKYFLKKE